MGAAGRVRGARRVRSWCALAGFVVASLVAVSIPTERAVAASDYVSLSAPIRLVDTRPGFTTIDGQDAGTGIRPAGSTLVVEITGRAGIPTDTPVVVLNLTAVDPLDPGYLTAHATGTPRPNASSANYRRNTTTNNTVIARVGAGGDVCIFTRTATHLVVDVSGHFTGPPPPAAGPSCVQPQQIAYARAEALGAPWVLPALWLMDADGSDHRRLETGIYVDGGPAWSPDGTMIAFTGFDPDVPAPGGVVPDIWVVDTDGTGLRNVTNLSGPDFALSPSWSPDGQQIAYVTTAWDIWIVDADGTDNRRITNDIPLQESVDWSPDGSLLVYNANLIVGTLLTGTNEIWTIEPDGDNPTRLTDPGNRAGPMWSSDGTEIAFAGYDFSGPASQDHSDVWIMNADGSGRRNLTDDPTRFDGSPSWSPDGSMIAFDSDGPFGPYVDPVTGETDCCVNDPPADIYVMPTAGGPKTQLTFGDAIEVGPAWQPLPASPTTAP